MADSVLARAGHSALLRRVVLAGLPQCTSPFDVAVDPSETTKWIFLKHSVRLECLLRRFGGGGALSLAMSLL